MHPLAMADPSERPGLEGAARGAAAAGTPWLSSFALEEMVELARGAGFTDARHVSTPEVAERYLADRSDGLTASGGEGILLTTT